MRVCFTRNTCAFTQFRSGKRSVLRLRRFHHELSWVSWPFLDSPFNLLASLCVLAGTGNSTTALRFIYILEQIKQSVFFFFLAPIDVAVTFLAFCRSQTI